MEVHVGRDVSRCARRRAASARTSASAPFTVALMVEADAQVGTTSGARRPDRVPPSSAPYRRAAARATMRESPINDGLET